MGCLQDREAAKRWYDHVSAFYEPVVASTFWPESLQRRLLARLDLTEDDRVLDVGCGTGLTTQYLGDRAGRVDGIDHSPPQLAQTADRPARFLRGDAEYLPYRTDTFDAVVSVGAILYFPEPVAALREACRVTRSGGRVLIAGFNQQSFPSWNPIENWAHLANETLFCTYDPEDAREMFEDGGWTDVESSVTGPAWHPPAGDRDHGQETRVIVSGRPAGDARGRS